MSDLEELVSMGFSESESRRALESGGDVSGAIEWLDTHSGMSRQTLDNEQQVGEARTSREFSNENARSLVCNDCRKTFRSTFEAEFHASKTAHVGFSESSEEIAPLSAEEKASKLKDMRARAAVRKAAISESDRNNQKRNEEIRRKNTKDASDAKLELARKAQLSEAVAQKREKQAAIEARSAVRAKISADKDERRRKARIDLDHADLQRPLPQTADPTASTVTTSQTPRTTTSHSRLKIQTSSGSVFHTLPVDTTLTEIARLVHADKGLSLQEFRTTFPQRRWDRPAFGITLQEAGLVPSANLIAE